MRRVAVLLICALALFIRVSHAQYGGTLDVPQTNLAPLGQSPGFAQSGSVFSPGVGPTLSAPPPTMGGLDPYAIPTPGGFGSPTYPGAAIGGAPMGGGLFSSPGVFSGGTPAVPAPGFGIPSFGTAPASGGFATPLGPGQMVPSNSFGGPQFGGPSGFGGGTYPSSAYPSGTPSTLFPGGLFSRTPGFGGTPFSAYRFLQGPRIRHTTVLSSDDPDALTTNDTDVSIAFAFPSFLGGPQPLYIVPSFSFHQFDGPAETQPGADLPPNVYSAFLDAGWQTDPNQILGAELGVRVGVFSEFDILRGDSLRVMGKGLGSIRLTPVSTFKLGVYYLDRNKIKLLPAGGLLWQPNPFTRFDIFFPQPKIARYWRTVGTRDVWWFAGGEYGGGNWTIDRDDGREDEVDLNDIRVSVGLEWGQSDWIRQGRRTGFVEFGYVFDRELVYRQSPQDDTNLDDGFMVRLGIGY